MIQILYKSKQLVIIYKPPGIPSQSDLSGDEDAMSLTRAQLSAIGERDALWLVHRLDRVVGGVMAFARTKACAADLTELITSERMTKEYYAVLDGKAEEGVFEDLLYKDAAKGKAFVVDRERRGVKRAVLTCRTLAAIPTDKGDRTLAKITLHTGRFHQIRAQLSSRGWPVTGDGKYGSHDNAARSIALFACHLAFDVLGERVDVSIAPDRAEYPWSLFSEDDFK